MKFSVLTLFPEMLSALGESIIGRAINKGIIETEYINIRDFSKDKHRRVDDYPYGAGGGMVMQPQPIYDAYKSVAGENKPHVIYMSPQGATLTQNKAKELAKYEHLVILCGHYEGVDERILEEIVDEEISIGDYVLTGGELPAMVVIDCVSRMIEGVLDSEETASVESHYNGLLEYPQYTRPPEFMGREVPEILLSGHHANIEKWRREQSILRTAKKRPDLIEKADLTEKEKVWLENELKGNG
ncbi:MAG: tRNA (guanosine(37)-N1)-methyltransferase TrmD [Ruminococcaceae bacterium]|nr:tRNA (guanosine(37)-N1)-methyltransferase TrmD [Oscillospiraceae bacterium]